MAEDSILDKTKKILGIEAEYDVFDIDIITHINSVFATLTQLGIGPEEGYMIEDNSTQWDEYLENKLYLNSVKSYMYLRVRVLFDPPTTSFALSAMSEQIKEMEFRLSLYAPKTVYPGEPVVPVVPTGTRQAPWNLTGGLEFPSYAKIGDYGIDYETGNVWRNDVS